jgi:outer membrane protein assembly factor BamE (lipoprotein component of BamABCDE complex)
MRIAYFQMTIYYQGRIGMKKTIVVFALAALLSGCATSHYSTGRDFPSANVSQISKGKTTTSELQSLFGEPFAKSPVNETDEKWVYTYTNGSAHAQSYIVTMQVTTTGTQKTLDVLIRNGVVINYTFTDGPLPGSRTQ